MMDKFEQTHSRNMNIFLIGYVLYSLAFVYNRTTPSYLIIIANELILFIGIGMVIFALISSIRLKNTTHGYVKLILALLMIWFYILITWSLKPEYGFIKIMLFSGESSLMSYLVPLVVLIPKKILFLKKTMTAIIVLGVGYFLYMFLFRDNIFTFYGNSVANERYVFEYCAKWLSISAGFLALTFSYLSKKARYFAALLIIATLLTALFRARRTLIFMSILPVLIASVIYVFRSRYKLFAILMAAIVGVGVLFSAMQLYEDQKDGFFENLTGRIDQDSRSGVDECFINDFSLKDWVIGRGFDGRYFCPNVDENYDVVGYRTMIETDFLNIILKSGSIYLALLLLIMFPAAYNGLFRSQNILSKAAGSWILFWILCLYPANVFGFSLNYLLVWLSIGICFSKEIRNIPDAVLKDYFLNGKEISDSVVDQNQ